MAQVTDQNQMTFIKFVPDFPVKDLKPFEENPRFNDKAVPAISESIGTYGKVNPIIVDENFRICAGNTRYKACLERGTETFPVMIFKFQSENAFLAFNIADNQTATIADFIDTDVSDILNMLKNENEDGLLSSLGFDDNDLRSLLIRVDDCDDNFSFNDADKNPIGQMTFALTTSQIEVIKQAIKKANHQGNYDTSANQNSNGNALHRICEDYLGKM